MTPKWMIFSKNVIMNLSFLMRSLQIYSLESKYYYEARGQAAAYLGRHLHNVRRDFRPGLLVHSHNRHACGSRIHNNVRGPLPGLPPCLQEHEQIEHRIFGHAQVQEG